MVLKVLIIFYQNNLKYNIHTSLIPLAILYPNGQWTFIIIISNLNFELYHYPFCHEGHLHPFQGLGFINSILLIQRLVSLTRLHNISFLLTVKFYTMPH
jgi:hypothetical protein